LISSLKTVSIPSDPLLNDILIIDTAKPVMALLPRRKKALLADHPYETCGGRMPPTKSVDTAQPVSAVNL